MSQILFLSLPMSLLWMIFAQQVTLETFIIGYIFGFAALLAVRVNTRSFREESNDTIDPLRIPMQLFYLLVYIALLARDVFLSGIDVATRVMVPSLHIAPDVQRVPTQDDSNNALVSALSAHSITITPGELVIDFEEEDGQTIMLVHTLDKNSSTMEKLTEDQSERLRLIRRILGHKQKSANDE